MNERQEMAVGLLSLEFEHINKYIDSDDQLFLFLSTFCCAF